MHFCLLSCLRAYGLLSTAKLTRLGVQAVTHALEVIIERKEAEAQSIVAQSYQEFVDSMAELRHVQARQQPPTRAAGSIRN